MEEHEVEDVLTSPGEDRGGYEGARVALGQTRAGRYLRIVYVPDPDEQAIFVITACDLRDHDESGISAGLGWGKEVVALVEDTLKAAEDAEG